MTEKIALSKLNAHKIYSCVAKGVSTLQDLAKNYDCSYEQFVAECKRKISPFEWKRILKADERNQKIRSDRKENKKVMEHKVCIKKNNDQKLRIIRDEMATVEEKLEISKAVLEDFQERVAKFKNDEETAKKLYEETVRRRQWAENNLVEAQDQVARYEERMKQLNQKLDEFNTYLVAPGYKGEIPRGRIVSVTSFEGYNVSIEKGDDLLNDVSFASIMKLGFETFKEADMVLEFAKLVLKYQMECDDEFKILVDDERIITILHGQEVEI